MKCSFCEIGTLHVKTDIEEVSYKGGKLKVEGYQFYNCDHCHQDIISSAQMKMNRQLIADAKRSMDGLLSGSKIKSIREKLHLSQEEASIIFGGGPNSFYKYENGEVIQSSSMDTLMLLASESTSTYSRIRIMKGLPPLREDSSNIAIPLKNTKTNSPSDYFILGIKAGALGFTAEDAAQVIPNSQIESSTNFLDANFEAIRQCQN